MGEWDFPAGTFVLGHLTAGKESASAVPVPGSTTTSVHATGPVTVP
jgi:hypothetical protein